MNLLEVSELSDLEGIGVTAAGRVDIAEEDFQLVGDPERARQTMGSEIKMCEYPHLTERGTSSLLGGLGVNTRADVIGSEILGNTEADDPGEMVG